MNRISYFMEAEGARGSGGPEDIKYYGVANPKLFDTVLGAMHNYFQETIPLFDRQPVEVRDIWLENSVERLQIDRHLVMLRRRTLFGVGIDRLAASNSGLDPNELVGKIAEGNFSDLAVPLGYEVMKVGAEDGKETEKDRYHWFLFTQKKGL
jgi:hypothetical protein